MNLPLALPPAESRLFDVVGVGESSADLVALVDRYPEAGSKQALRSLARLPGGQAATAMVACARQGWRTRYVGCLGADDDGVMIAESLAREGVDVVAVRRAGALSRVGVILVDERTGGRTILEHRSPALALSDSEIDSAIVTGGRVLLVDASDPGAARFAAAAARAAHIPVVVDIERPAPESAELLRHVDVLIVAEDFPVAYTGAADLGEALRRLESEFRPAVVVATLGPAGSLARCRGEEIRTSAFRVDTVDTTGAGDAFRGGFISGWLRFGPEVSVSNLLEYSNAVAAHNCQSLGAQAGLPNRTELDLFVTRHGRAWSK